MNFTINGFEVFLRTIPLMSVTHAGFISIKDYKISKGILLWCNISYNSPLFFFFLIQGNPSVCLFVLFCFTFCYREVLWLFFMSHQKPVLGSSVTCRYLLSYSNYFFFWTLYIYFFFKSW